MASLVLGTVGYAIGGPLGGFIGSTIGSYVDNQLFPVKQEGPRLTDLSVSASTYGMPIPWARGPECRFAPAVIWSTPLKETKHVEGGKGGPATQMTSYTYSVSVALLIGKPIVGVTKVWANSKLIYGGSYTGPIMAEKANGAGLWGGARVYLGTKDQLPDPLIQATEGAENTPAYRGRSYIVIEDLQLADFGNRVPQFEVQVAGDAAVTAGEIVADIMAACGIDPTLQGTGIDDEVRGYVIGRPVSGAGAINPLSIAFNFDVAEVDGAMRLQRRGLGPAGVIDIEHLGARDQSDGSVPDKINWKRARETDLPRAAAITYRDPNRDYQESSARASRRSGSAQNDIQSELAVTMDADKAQQVVDRLLWEAWTSRESATVRTDDRYISVQPGLTYLFRTAAGLEPLRIVRKSRGVNGLIELELKRDRAEVFQSSNRGFTPVVPVNEIRLPGETWVQLIDTHMLSDREDDNGFYVAFEGEGPYWRGANLLMSSDGGATFESILASGKTTVIGSASAFGPTQAVTWDNATEITITLMKESDALESMDDDAVLRGKNAMWIGPASGQGGEVLFFANAEEDAPGVWTISRLIRGRKGTNQEAWMTHPDGHVAVLLEVGAVDTVDLGAAEVGRTRPYQAVSLLMAPADSNVFSFTNTGMRQKPLSPTLARAQLIAGSLEVSWTRRTRFGVPGMGYGAVVLGEDAEAYMVEIARPAPVSDPGNPVRRLWVTSPAFSYSAAHQTDDGYGPGDTIEILVYQMPTADETTAGAGTPLEILYPL